MNGMILPDLSYFRYDYKTKSQVQVYLQFTDFLIVIFRK
mgnify:CR=1 FL=1